MTSSIGVKFDCSICGATLTWPEEITDHEHVVCKQCGNDAGAYGDMRNRAIDAAKAEVARLIEKTLKGH